jgi:hypothetical protein
MLNGIDWSIVTVAVVFAAMCGGILTETRRIRRSRRADHGWMDETFRDDVLVAVEMENIDDEYKRLVREST